MSEIKNIVTTNAEIFYIKETVNDVLNNMASCRLIIDNFEDQIHKNRFETDMKALKQVVEDLEKIQNQK